MEFNELSKQRVTQHLYSLGLGFGAVFVVALFAFPVYWMLISAIKPPDMVMSYPPKVIPTELSADNFLFLVERTEYLQWLINSAIISTGNVLLSVTLSALAGYAFTRYEVYGKKNIARGFIVAYMFPILMLGIPYYLLYSNLGLLNTRIGVIFGHAAVTIPFTTWLLWQFFQTVPVAWEESAWTMGAPWYRTMFEIALPGALPGIIASSIFAFGVSWNDFTFAFLVLSGPENQVLTTGIQQFAAQTRIYWGPLMAGASVLALPPLLLVLFLNRYILAGFTIGGFD